MEYLFKNGLSNYDSTVELTVMEAIECLIKFCDCYDGNTNGIGSGTGGNCNTIDKCNIITASLFLWHMFLLFNRPYVNESQLFITKRSRSIHGVYEVSNDNLAIQPTRRCKILHNPMKQHVGGYHNNINDLKNSNVLQGVVAAIERFLVCYKYRFTVCHKFLNVILSLSNNNTGSGGKRGVGLDNCDNIGYIDTKMSDTAAFATQQTIPSSVIDISFAAFVKMTFVDNLIDNTFDILREWPLEDQVLTLLYSKMHQLMAPDTLDKLQILY